MIWSRREQQRQNGVVVKCDLGRLFDAAQAGPTLLDGSHDLVACSGSSIIGFHGYGCGTCEM